MVWGSYDRERALDIMKDLVLWRYGADARPSE
jgi:hypothetical protein